MYPTAVSHLQPVVLFQVALTMHASAFLGAKWPREDRKRFYFPAGLEAYAYHSLILLRLTHALPLFLNH